MGRGITSNDMWFRISLLTHKASAIKLRLPQIDSCRHHPLCFWQARGRIQKAFSTLFASPLPSSSDQKKRQFLFNNDFFINQTPSAPRARGHYNGPNIRPFFLLPVCYTLYLEEGFPSIFTTASRAQCLVQCIELLNPAELWEITFFVVVVYHKTWNELRHSLLHPWDCSAGQMKNVIFHSQEMALNPFSNKNVIH